MTSLGSFVFSVLRERGVLVAANACFTRTLIPYPRDDLYMGVNAVCGFFLIFVSGPWISFVSNSLFFLAFLGMNARYIDLSHRVEMAAANPPENID